MKIKQNDPAIHTKNRSHAYAILAPAARKLCAFVQTLPESTNAARKLKEAPIMTPAHQDPTGAAAWWISVSREKFTIGSNLSHNGAETRAQRAQCVFVWVCVCLCVRVHYYPHAQQQDISTALMHSVDRQTTNDEATLANSTNVLHV